MSHTTDVSLKMNQHYRISVGRNLWNQVRDYFSQNHSSAKLITVIDENVERLYRDRIEGKCGDLFDDIQFIVIPQGEQSKSIDQWKHSLDAILDNGIERFTPLLAIGGGVTGDLGGFVAASAMRGIPLIHMPTTLLAMVDSSIGGKTGINHSVAKNLIGSFYQPQAVFADVDYLETLPREEWINGLSEILKYAAIHSPSMFDSASECIAEGFRPTEKWEELISRSASIKVEVVEKDALESGVRAFLNFGHTFAHALEKNAGYGTISHGEAVLVGMLAASYASKEAGGRVTPNRFDDFIKLYSIQYDSSKNKIDELIEAMKQDKKVKDGNIRLVLLKEWGEPYIYTCRDQQFLFDAWEFALHTIIEH